MSADAVQAAIEELGQFPGMDGCALVEAETGMPWYHAGSAAGVERIAEAAIEFWRVQTRLSRHFEGMGNLQSAAYSFSNRVVALFPCGETPPLVLVCIARKSDVSWAEWGKRAVSLRQLLKKLTSGAAVDA
jgi:hypothetical protein